MRALITLLFFCWLTPSFAQGFRVNADAMLRGEFENYLAHNQEYRQHLQQYAQGQKTIDSCYVMLEKSALTIRNATQKLPYDVRRQVLQIIENAKNDRSGDIYEGFKQFDDPTMNSIKAIIRVPTIYECEIAILKARMRRKKSEEWATALSQLIEQYYYPEFMRGELNYKLATYQTLLPFEQHIDHLLGMFTQTGDLHITENYDALKQLLNAWEMNAHLLRNSDERQELRNFLKESLQ